MTITRTGIVKWYDPIRGYGFISLIHEKEDVFFHFNQIKQINLISVISLKKGDNVEFEIDKNRKGPFAKNIELIETN